MLLIKGAQCEHDVACSQRAEDGSRCRDVLRGCHNAHAPRDGQDRGVVARSVDRSASVRRYESTASKSGALRPTQPFCKRQDVAYVQSSARINGASEGPCSHRRVPMRLLGSPDSAPFMGEVRPWDIACYHNAGPAGLQPAASI
jgi:hypothetical protein